MDAPTWDSTEPIEQSAATPHAEVASPAQGADHHGATPTWDSTVDTAEYETPGQLAKTAIEGVSEGVLGPIAPLIEKHLLRVKPEEMLARREINSGVHGLGQAAGLVGSTVAGVGAAKVLGVAGEAAAAAAGLGEVAKDASLGFKVGHAAVTQAAEMAVLSGSDEVSKMILNDPNQSVESAIGNIGLSAALGGAGGAFMTGAVSPLWKATGAPAVEKGLAALRSRVNGEGRVVMPEAVKAAEDALGVQVPDILRAPVAGNKAAKESLSALRYGQNETAEEAIAKLQTDTSHSVMNSLGVPLEEAQVYSKNETGHALAETFETEYKKLYEPAEAAMQKRNLEAAPIALDDETRLGMRDRLLERAMNEHSVNSPIFKQYEKWSERLLEADNIGKLDKLKTELYNDMSMARRQGDENARIALSDIHKSFSEFQESQIERQAASLEKMGVDGAKSIGKDLLAERAAQNAEYAKFAGMSRELADHIGVGNFTGAGGLMRKVREAGAESLVNKFSPKNNADIIPFLQKYFPDTLAHVQKNELLDLIKPAIKNAKGESPIDINKLAKIIEDKMAGKKELVDFAINPEAMKKIEAAKTLMESIPGHKDSGTPGGLQKLLHGVPQSAMAALAMIAGHNPVMGAILGHVADKLGTHAPEALRLAHLKFLGSSEPIQAGGFKSMVDFFHNTYKGENMLSKSTQAIFQRGAQVLADHAMPDSKDREKLDKQVTKFQEKPDTFLTTQDGHLGHYLPNHQTAATATATNALQYLQHLKPQDHKLGPLDKAVPPQPAEIARYNRALNIAQQPAIVLHHIKEGTLQPSDIADLHTMYPSLYKSMQQKISNEMISMHGDEEPIPYRTRISMAMFLGTPVDKSMEPASILAAQPKPKAPVQQQQAQGASGKSTKSLNKSANAYKTPNQTAESDRSNRD